MEHLDYINMAQSRLDERGKELSEAIKGKYLNEERKWQVQHELGLISFELWMRYQESDIETSELVEV